MKFINITIDNFRQYYGLNSINLGTEEGKNIVLIGGRNGYGKTNFLLSIVWCLYGEKIGSIDDNFKKEIQKEKNFSSFMQHSLNWTAKNDGKTAFSVSLEIEDSNLLSTSDKPINQIIIKREFDTKTLNETLSIINTETKEELLDTDEDKVNFINDYIIPLDAAKFVFFDAEKISEIANFSIKEEGSFINDALSKILGLDTYETLAEDFLEFTNTLKKEGASHNLQTEITDKERAIEIANFEIEKFEEANATHLKEIDTLKKEIRQYEGLISSQSKTGTSQFDRDSILNELNELIKKEETLGNQFNDLSEVIPLAILTGNIEQVMEHLRLQDKNVSLSASTNEGIKKVGEFIELLFNKPPEPDNSTMSLKDKLFYYEKAQKLSSELFEQSNDESIVELNFEFDLNNTEKELINEASYLVNTQSKELFESIIDQFNETKIKLNEQKRKLARVDADLEDDLVLDYSSKKETAEFYIGEHNRKIGENNQNIIKLKTDIQRLRQQLGLLVQKVDINEKNKLKIQKSHQYIDTLNSFLEDQKKQHKSNLEQNILDTLKTLMHKLNDPQNESKLIESVRVTILATGQGMKISLFDQYDNEIKKESLSSGEKQIYISCLIKAILKESVRELPIFIDTPLGRLDEEHRDTITTQYYPNLSEQVVLFSTNSEITPKRFKNISNQISHSYLLENNGVDTILKPGYFQSYEN